MACLMVGCLFGLIRIRGRAPSYQLRTKTLNTPTAWPTAPSYSASQSTVSPDSERWTSPAAMLDDSRASVTPEEKTGSRNSEALPVTAQPGPWNLVVAAAHPDSLTVLRTGEAFRSLRWMLGSSWSSERSRSRSQPETLS